MNDKDKTGNENFDAQVDFVPLLKLKIWASATDEVSPHFVVYSRLTFRTTIILTHRKNNWSVRNAPRTSTIHRLHPTQTTREAKV